MAALCKGERGLVMQKRMVSAVIMLAYHTTPHSAKSATKTSCWQVFALGIYYESSVKVTHFRIFLITIKFWDCRRASQNLSWTLIAVKLLPSSRRWLTKALDAAREAKGGHLRFGISPPSQQGKASRKHPLVSNKFMVPHESIHFDMPTSMWSDC